MSRPPRRPPAPVIEGRARYVGALRLGVRALADLEEAADARICLADAQEARLAARELERLAAILDGDSGRPRPRPRTGATMDGSDG